MSFLVSILPPFSWSSFRPFLCTENADSCVPAVFSVSLLEVAFSVSAPLPTPMTQEHAHIPCTSQTSCLGRPSTQPSGLELACPLYAAWSPCPSNGLSQCPWTGFPNALHTRSLVFLAECCWCPASNMGGCIEGETSAIGYFSLDSVGLRFLTPSALLPRQPPDPEGFGRSGSPCPRALSRPSLLLLRVLSVSPFPAQQSQSHQPGVS